MERPMPTVGKQIADEIKDGDGYYADDPRVVRIVEYTDMGGKLAYGLEYGHELGKYEASPYVRYPRVYWEADTDAP
jgi:hypothetical protein